MFDIITFGSATKDVFLRTEEGIIKDEENFTSGKGLCFSLGSKIKCEDIYFTIGGGGTNSAVTFVNQGYFVSYYGIVGNDEAGESVIKELKNNKIDTRFVSFTDKKRTNHSIVIDIPNKDRTIFVYRGASDIENNTNNLDSLYAKWFYIAPFSSSGDLFCKIIDHGKQNNTKIMINPEKSQLCNGKMREYLKKSDILIMNMEEASIFTGIDYNKEKEIILSIIDEFSGIILITKGHKGVIAYHDSVFYSAIPIITSAIDKTGAGDSFGSGFLSEYMRSGDMESSIQLGIANSSSCVQKQGAKGGLLHKNDEYSRVNVLKGDINEVIN